MATQQETREREERIAFFKAKLVLHNLRRTEPSEAEIAQWVAECEAYIASLDLAASPPAS